VDRHFGQLPREEEKRIELSGTRNPCEDWRDGRLRHGNPVETPGTDEYTGRSVSCEEDAHESGEAMEEDYDLEEKEDITDDAILAAGRSSGESPLVRNPMEELDEVVGPEPAFGGDDDDEGEDDDDDSKQAVTTSQVTEQKTGYRPPMNGDTPAANKVLGRTYEEMMEKTVTTTTTGHVASDTVQFLKSMGLQAPTQAVLESWIPAEAGADLLKWKHKLRVGFGVTDIHYPQPPVGKTAAGGVDPSKIPLLKTPSKGYNIVPKSHGVFSKSGGKTPYFQDSHIITPKSSGKKERSDRDSGRANATRSTMRGSRRSWDRNRYDEDSSSSDDDDDIYRRLQQDGIEKASSPEGERLTQKLELVTHHPLGQIRAFSGLQNKSQNSMQWLRGFVYEMKGIHTSPDEWSMPFQLSLKDGALHWHRQLLKKTKRTWSLLSSLFIRYYCAQYNQTAETRYYSAMREDKEHICDYLNRLNGYARNAGIQFDKGCRKARDQLKRFLEICGDRALERRLCQVKVCDILELEEMIIEILNVDDCESAKGSSQSRYRSHDTGRSKRSDYPRDGYSRGDHFGRRRDDSRNIPRVTFAEGSKALETQKTYTSDEDDRHDIYDDYNYYDNHDEWNADESRYTDEEREEYDDPADEAYFAAAANEVERRNEADGMNARSDARVPKTE
ncbi:hypothetical protein PHMEG_00030343, partial [Phytophthora megakarya]